MSSSVASMLEKSSEVNNKQQVPTQEHANQSKNPLESPITECYLENSEFYQIRGGFIAEVIQNPFVKFIDKGMTERVIQDLRKVTLAAFGKTEDEAEIYASDEVMRKNAVLVDWLTVVRKGTRIVAYTSASYIERNILYLNSSIVDPEFQCHSGLGILPHMYVWQEILESRLSFKTHNLTIVGRTCNKAAVSVMEHVWERVMISGEDNVSSEYQQIFKETAKVLSSSYEEATGIAKDVYPVGLPNGSGMHNEKLNKLFNKLKLCDAFYIAGKVNIKKVMKFVHREIVKINKVNIVNIEHATNLRPLLNVA